MKLLLTSGGISNKSIEKAFFELVGKSAGEIKVAFIPTASNAEAGDKSWLIKDLVKLTEMGLEIDIIELAVLPLEEIKKRIKEVDVLFFEGGTTSFLMYWINKSGFAGLLPELLKTKVWVGVSAGSIVVGKTISDNEEGLYGEDDDKYGKIKGLELVNFETRVHLGSEWFPDITKEKIQELAEKTGKTFYILDDNSAIVVINDKIEVVSEGDWGKFE